MLAVSTFGLAGFFVDFFLEANNLKNCRGRIIIKLFFSPENLVCLFTHDVDCEL